jgi:hypothetical protein
MAEIDALYAQRESELASQDFYAAGQTWARFQQAVCKHWPSIRATVSSSTICTEDKA